MLRFAVDGGSRLVRRAVGVEKVGDDLEVEGGDGGCTQTGGRGCAAQADGGWEAARAWRAARRAAGYRGRRARARVR
jgi:hypothetical protein